MSWSDCFQCLCDWDVFAFCWFVLSEIDGAQAGGSEEDFQKAIGLRLSNCNKLSDKSSADVVELILESDLPFRLNLSNDVAVKVLEWRQSLGHTPGTGLITGDGSLLIE